MVKKHFFVKLSLEVIAIIIGISVSFWLNELSIKNKNKTQRQRVLNNLLIEVQDIEKYCNERISIWSQDIKIYNNLLEEDLNITPIKNEATSKRRVEYNLIYYRDFAPPMNRYKSLLNTGDLKYLKSENIKEKLTRLHNINFSKIISTVEYEKSLKGQIISLLTLEYPSVFLKANNPQIIFDDYLYHLHQIIKKDKRLKSDLIVQMSYFKTRLSSLKFYQMSLEELKDELRRNLGLN